MVHEETYLVTYHSSLATVRRWDLENGFLVWETTLNESLAKRFSFWISLDTTLILWILSCIPVFFGYYLVYHCSLYIGVL